MLNVFGTTALPRHGTLFNSSPPPIQLCNVTFKMAELLLDSAIRVWVILPIVMITFFVGIIRHYLSILLQTTKKLELEQVSDR